MQQAFRVRRGGGAGAAAASRRRIRARSSRLSASRRRRHRRESGVLLQAEQIRRAKAEVRPLRPPARASARTRDTSVVAEVLIARIRAFGSFRSNSIVGRFPPTPMARRKIRFFRDLWWTRTASQMSHGAMTRRMLRDVSSLHVAWRYLECGPVAPPVVEYRRRASLCPQPHRLRVRLRWDCQPPPPRTHTYTHRQPAYAVAVPQPCCTAGMQLLSIESAGTAAEMALLADVKSKNPDATATELLRLFQVRHRWALLVRSADLSCVVLCVRTFYVPHVAPNWDHARPCFVHRDWGIGTGHSLMPASLHSGALHSCAGEWAHPCSHGTHRTAKRSAHRSQCCA